MIIHYRSIQALGLKTKVLSKGTFLTVPLVFGSYEQGRFTNHTMSRSGKRDHSEPEPHRTQSSERHFF